MYEYAVCTVFTGQRIAAAKELRRQTLIFCRFAIEKIYILYATQHNKAEKDSH